MKELLEGGGLGDLLASDVYQHSTACILQGSQLWHHEADRPASKQAVSGTALAAQPTLVAQDAGHYREVQNLW